MPTLKKKTRQKCRTPRKAGQITQILRKHLAECQSINVLAFQSGVAQPSLSRFITGERDLRLQTADAVCGELGLALVLVTDSSNHPSRGSLTATLKAALSKQESLYEFAKQCGVAYPCLFRFVKGERDLRLGTVDRVCAALGLGLVKK